MSRVSSSGVLLLFLLLGAMLAAGGRVSAAVLGSPHDLFGQKYLAVSEERLNSNPQCLLCHHSAPDDRPMIWQTVPTSLKYLGSVGITCASCHDGVSIVDRNVDAGLTVFHPDSHGLDANNPPLNTQVADTGLPNVTEGMMTCLTCHDPHNQANRPFLRGPLDGLCARCHVGKIPLGYGPENSTGNHPSSIEPFDNTGGTSPISVQPYFAVPFPMNYPNKDGIMSTRGHWTLGGHLSNGNIGRIECMTCHAIHGSQEDGPVADLLAKDPVRQIADEFCEGCHRGQRGDGGMEPPFPNPGGTITGRTYHPADDDISNGIDSAVAIADSMDLAGYIWGEYDPETEMPRILCTTCHQAHNGMRNSPCLVDIDEIVRTGSDVTTFCEICHREPPYGHHGYNDWEGSSSTGLTIQIPIGNGELGEDGEFGFVYGSELRSNTVYCAHCHRAHNAGYQRNEEDYIPILVEKGVGLCSICHVMGVTHFMGDPTLPSTYNKNDSNMRRIPWPGSNRTSYYEGEGTTPMGVTCLSCHNLATPEAGERGFDHYLLAPADEDAEWTMGYPEEYLCTGCHGEAPATVGGGETHPLMTADFYKYPDIKVSHLLPGETAVTYTPRGSVNCHSCHRAHGAVINGGLYILKICRGENLDPRAIQPRVDFTDLCDSCHPYK